MSRNSKSPDPNVGAQARLHDHLVEDLLALVSSSGHARGKTEILFGNDSDRTSETAIQILIDGFNELRAAGYELSSPWSVREMHIRYLMHLWVDKSGQGPTVVLSKLNCWRDLAKNMRKAALLATIEDWLKEPGGRGRRYARRNGTIREDLYIDVRDVVASLTRLAEQDRWVSVQVELQSAFKLRATSSMLFRPLEFLRLSGQLHIPDGSQKNGRPRVITLDERWQYDLLLRAVRLSSPTTGVMFPPPWTLKTWCRHYHNVLRSLGLSRTIWGDSMDGVPICALSMAYADRMPNPSQSPEHTGDPFVDHFELRLDRDARRAAMLRLIECVTLGLPLSRQIRVGHCVDKRFKNAQVFARRGTARD